MKLFQIITIVWSMVSCANGVSSTVSESDSAKKVVDHPPSEVLCTAYITQDWTNSEVSTEDATYLLIKDIKVGKDNLVTIRQNGVFTNKPTHEFKLGEDSAEIKAIENKVKEKKISSLNSIFLAGDQKALEASDFSEFELVPQIVHYGDNSYAVEAFFTIKPNLPNSPVGILSVSSRNTLSFESSILLHRTTNHKPSPVNISLDCKVVK